MGKKQMKPVGIGCLVVAAVCVFVGVERYNTNAGNVQAINQLRGSSPFGDMVMGGELKAAIPVATKYALLLAAISGSAGGFLLVKSAGGES